MMKSSSYGFLAINKPVGISSFDVIRQLRRQGFPKKMGHIGTLDPFASGLMIIGVGEAVKFISHLLTEPKIYRAQLQLGKSTDTLDHQGEVQDVFSVPLLEKPKIKSVLASFLGDQLQIPPMYSAKKKEGKRLYELARQGVEIARDPVPIKVYDIKLIFYENEMIDFEVSVSTGTYIRVLGADIASKLGTVGHLIGLQRVQIDQIKLEQAVDLDKAELNLLMSTESLLSHYKKVEVEEENFYRLMNGLTVEDDSDPEKVQLYYKNNFIGLGQIVENQLKALRLLNHDILKEID